MNDLSPLEIKILELLSNHPNGLEEDIIYSKIKIKSKNALESILDNLDTQGLIAKVNDFKNNKTVWTGKWAILEQGNSFLLCYKSVCKQTNFNKWKECLCSFIIGVLIGFICKCFF